MTAGGWSAMGVVLAFGGAALVALAWAARATAPSVTADPVPSRAWWSRCAAALDLPVPGPASVGAGGAVAVAAVGVWCGAAPWRAVAVVVGAGVVPIAAARRRGVGVARRGIEELVAVVEALGSHLAGGASISQALEAVAAAPGPRLGLADVASAVRHGEPVQQALDRWAGQADLPEAWLLADALAVAGRTGASRAAALERVAVTAREHADLRGEVRAQAAQARASAVVLVVAPLAFAAGTAALDPAVRGVLLGRPVGWACLAGGLALDLIGARCMGAIVRAAR